MTHVARGTVGTFRYQRALLTAGHGLPKGLHHTALALAVFADGITGENVRPALATLAAAMGFSDSDAIGRHVRELESRGWLAVVHKPHAQPVVYRLTIPAPAVLEADAGPGATRVQP